MNKLLVVMSLALSACASAHSPPAAGPSPSDNPPRLAPAPAPGADPGDPAPAAPPPSVGPGDPATPAPAPAKSATPTCPAGQHYDVCASSSCPVCTDCVAACVPN